MRVSVRIVRSFFLGVILASVSAAAFAIPTFNLSFGARTNSLLPLIVAASDVTDLYAYQFSLSFEPNLLHVVSINEGGFLATGGSTFFDPGTIDNAAGTVSFVFDTLIGPVAGVSGSGPLATVGLQVVNSGLAHLSLSDVVAVSSSGATLTIATPVLAAQVPEPGALWLVLAAAAALGVSRSVRRRPERAAV
jgi:hypothetical protein